MSIVSLMPGWLHGWLATDIEGHIGHFPFHEAPIPVEAAYNFEVMSESSVRMLARERSCDAIVEQNGLAENSPHRAIAERGIFTFESDDYDLKYELVARPAIPCRVSEFQEDPIRNALSLVCVEDDFEVVRPVHFLKLTCCFVRGEIQHLRRFCSPDGTCERCKNAPDMIWPIPRADFPLDPEEIESRNRLKEVPDLRNKKKPKA